MITIFGDFFFSFLLYSLQALKSYLQEVPSAASHHGSLFAFKAVYHHYQVHVGILLSDSTVTPDAFYFVVCVLRKQTEKGHMAKSSRAFVHRPNTGRLPVSYTTNGEGSLLLNRQAIYKVTKAVLVGKLGTLICSTT